MLNPDFIRENPDQVRKNTQARNLDSQIVDQWLETDKKWRRLNTDVEKLQAKRNELAQKIGQAGKKPGEKELKEGRRIKERVQKLEEKLKRLRRKWEKLIFQIPNLAHEDVPLGKDENQNLVLKKWGQKPKFKFKPLDHFELGEKLGLIDLASAGKVSGPRFSYLIGEGVLLELALIQYAFEVLINEGFLPVIPPVMVKRKVERALGYAEHGGWEEMYLLEKNKEEKESRDDDLVLVATSEHSLVAKNSGQILDLEKPLRYLGFSTCFRREAGSYGRDVRGIMRGHQFDKVEMVSFARPEDSEKEHLYLLSLEEKLVQGLGLPYQVTKMCTGDLAHPQAERYDLETWFPGLDKYRETHSCSNCTDYQARRLKIRFRDKGKTEFVHTLNATALAIPRTIITLLENHQQKDGSVIIPPALQKWFGKDIIGSVHKT